MNSYSKRERYYEVVSILSYLRVEKDYLPWKTVSKHVKDIVDVIEYRPSFYQFSVRIIQFKNTLQPLPPFLLKFFVLEFFQFRA